MKCNSVLSSFAIAATLLFLHPLPLRAAEDSGPLTADERAAFLAELQPLQDRLAALRRAPNVSPDRWADAQIFVKGVVWALDFGPVTDAKSRQLLRTGLHRARQRIEALSTGRAPWAERPGRSVRGFISVVDNSVQPYGLVIPAGYDPAKPIRLDVVLHGSANATGIGELLFLKRHDVADSDGAGAPANQFIEVHPMGRLGENAYRFEGETDVDEAIEAVCRGYNIDRSRIVLRGSSLGGVGAWQLGLKRPDRYVAVGPAAGPVDTYVFANSPWKHFVRLDPLTPWQKTMLHLVDAIDYTANAGMVPVVAAMGDQDPYFSSHLLIEEAFQKEGIPFNGIVAQGAGHGLSAAARQEQLKRLGEYAARGTDAFPKHVRFVTWTLKFSRCHWIEVLGLAEHYQRAEIDARIADNGAITLAEPQNITRFAVHSPAVADEAGSVTIGGARITLPAAVDGASRPLLFEKRDGKWTCPGTLDSVSLTGKRPGLQGPMDDAFARPFLCVRGTGKAWNPNVGAWAEANLNRFADEWRRHYRGYLPVKSDTEVTDADVRRSNLILFGDPGSNVWILVRKNRPPPITASS
jgi:poly(3-hydroxybutyrate) depolymerase